MFTVKKKNNTSLSEIKKTLIIIVSDNFKKELKANFDNDVVKLILKNLESSDFKGDKLQKTVFYNLSGISTEKIIIISSGEKATLENYQKIGGLIEKSFDKKHKKASLVFLSDLNKEKKSSILLGACLNHYRFDKYKTKDDDKKIEDIQINIIDDNEKQLKNILSDIDAIQQGVFTARDLVSEPANKLHPESYAEFCKTLESFGLKIMILNEKKMLSLGMNSLLGVGQGSRKESKAVILEWKGGKKKDKFLSLVGKGVTFDTGGISLKPARGMWDMIFDMGGSAAVVGTMVTLAKRNAKANIVGIIGLVENMPDGDAIRPGDVLTTMSKQTVEVLNTDAEGRLVLADIMTYIQKNYSLSHMIDLATLTGAIISALGHEYAGIFSNNDTLSDQLLKAGQATDEKLWRLPMGEVFSKKLQSKVADIANIASSPEAGSITAAEFLKHFVEDDLPWAHLDIAGTAWSTKNMPLGPKGATAFGVRLLNQFIMDNIETGA